MGCATEREARVREELGNTRVLLYREVWVEIRSRSYNRSVKGFHGGICERSGSETSGKDTVDDEGESNNGERSILTDWPILHKPIINPVRCRCFGLLHAENKRMTAIHMSVLSLESLSMS